MSLGFPEKEAGSTCRQMFSYPRSNFKWALPCLRPIKLSLVTSQVRQGNNIFCSAVSRYLLLQSRQFPSAPLGMLSHFQSDTLPASIDTPATRITLPVVTWQLLVLLCLFIFSQYIDISSHTDFSLRCTCIGLFIYWVFSELASAPCVIWSL